MLGLGAVGVVLLAFLLGAEHAAPGTLNASAKAAAAVWWAAEQQLPARLEQATLDALEMQP